MGLEMSEVFHASLFFIALIAVTGIMCILLTRNFIRALIGIEIITKAVTFLIIIVGFATGNMAKAQALSITLIIVEVVVIAMAAGLVLGIFRHNKELDVRKMNRLKG